MDNRPSCAENENIVRAIRSAHWDQKNQRWSSELFRGPETSVSRLRILSLNKIFQIFCADLHKPPVNRVIKSGEINIGELQNLGLRFTHNGKPDARTITVKEDPIINHDTYTDNPAHAVILEKLPSSLAHTIANKLHLHDAPNCTWLMWRVKLIVLSFVLLAVFLMVAW